MTNLENPSSSGEWDAFIGASVDIPRWSVDNIYEPQIENSNPATLTQTGLRNVTWLLQTSHLKFIENRSV